MNCLSVTASSAFPATPASATPGVHPIPDALCPMPRRRASSSDTVLSHLKKCPKCAYYIGAPIMCKGKSDEGNEGFYYEKCLNNRQPLPDTCKYFKWRKDLGRGKSARGKEHCSGALCKAAAKQAMVNLDCSFGVCSRCCKHIQPQLATPVSCAVVEHRKGVETKSNSKVAATPHPGRGCRKEVKSLSLASEVDEESSDECEIVDTPPARAPPKRGSYSTPVSPAYVGRVSEIDAEKIMRAERLANLEREAQARSHMETVSLRWWTTQGGDPDVLAVEVENPRAFHPKDVPLLVKRYQCDVEEFQYYDSKKRVWYTGQAGSAPRNVSKLNDDDLCYCTRGVTFGVGMPGTQNKRTAMEDPSFGPETPRRPQPPFRDYPMTPDSRVRRALSPATTPPGSRSSAWQAGFSSEDWGTPVLSIPPSPEPLDTFSAINVTTPPIPTLLAPPPQVVQAGPSLASARPAQHASSPDLSKAPRRQRAWPLKYACDMAYGFDRIHKLEDGYPAMSTDVAFKEVFQTEYKKSTYRDQHCAWLAAGQLPGEQARWIEYGRSVDGEWGKFMCKWRRKQ